MKQSMINKLASCMSVIAVATMGAGLSSCADDHQSTGGSPELQQKMSFKVSTNDYLNSATRAAAPAAIGQMTGGEDGITVTEVVDNSITGDASGRTTGDVTRGIPVENLEFATTTGYNGFKLMAATYDDTESWLTAKAAVTATNFINKIDVLGADDFETQYIWPGSTAAKKVAFFAWAPYTNTEKNTAVATDLTVTNEQGAPQLTYTVPLDNVSKQFDLITATAVDVAGDYNNVQQLQFNHVLSCIKFAAGNLRDCKITDIKLTNIHYKGTYTFPDETGGMGTWENTADVQTVCIGQGETADKKDVQTQVTGQEANFVLNAGEKNLMMLPQTLEQGAQLQVSFVFNSVDMNEKKTDSNGAAHATEKNGTVSRTYTIDLSGRRWESGKTYTYILSTNSVNNILLVERPKNFAYDGTTTDATFRVSSYKYVNGGQTEPLAWTAKYFACTESGAMGEEIAKPSWIEETTDAATNTTGGYQAYAMKLVAQQMTASGGAVSAITALQQADPIGTEAAPVDLSLRDVMGNELANGRSTANCYVVRQPGWYTFPLVYGNGIKDGVENGVALGSTTKINADGNTINNAYIYLDNSRGEDAIGDAVIVWQDAPQLITPASVQLTEDKHGIKFQIEKRHITQGNAVLAVRDNTDAHNILWSWHIWVTAQDFSDDALVTVPTNNPSTTDGIQSATFMPVYLGYCDGVSKEFKQRDFFVQIIQTESGKTATFKVTQTGKTVEYIGANAPYYEYGTMAPKAATKGFNESKKDIYDNIMDWTENSGSNTIPTAIKNPMAFYAVTNVNQYSTDYKDLWCAGSTQSGENYSYSIIKKTIYDPSPVNFTVPSSGAFSWFVTNYSSATSIEENQTTGSPIALVYQVDSKSIIMPQYGYRGNASTIWKIPNLNSYPAPHTAFRGATTCHSVYYGNRIDFRHSDYAKNTIIAIKEQ